MREIIIDTETTGLNPEDGHRIVELAAVELEGVRIGRRWHSYFDPGRPIDPGAMAVHGISDAQLVGQPTFKSQADSLIDFFDGAPLIAHNAPFDRRFIVAEMFRCGRAWEAEWIDTLPMARKKVPRKGHSLDALCKHYGIRRMARTIHGAVLDTILLAEVYVRLTGRLDQLELDGVQGGECFWLRGGEMIVMGVLVPPAPKNLPPGRLTWPDAEQRPESLPGRITLEEIRAHKHFMEQLAKDKAGARANSD